MIVELRMDDQRVQTLPRVFVQQRQGCFPGGHPRTLSCQTDFLFIQLDERGLIGGESKAPGTVCFDAE